MLQSIQNGFINLLTKMKALLLCVLVVFAVATDFEQQLAELEETKFGQTILQTIQMEL